MQYGDIALRKGGPTPLYRQVAAAIRDACARGELAPGERLPAIRTLADMLQVSQVTVAQAYELLRSEGVVAGHVGRGTFVQARAAPLPLAVPGPMSASLPVSAPPLTTDAAGPSLSAPAISSQVRAPRWQAVYLTQEQIYRRAPTAQEPIYFSRGVPDAALFPLRRWRHSMHLAADRLTPDDPTAAQYGPALGDPQLREVIATGLRRHGIRAEPQEILLTSGTLQSLDLIARTFLHPGATVFVEEVSYMAALDIFEQRPITWQPLPVDQQGLQIEALPAVAGVAAAASGRPRLLYTCPSGQSPTGYSMSQARRQLLAELADRYNLLVIADEAFNELYLDDPPPPPPAVQGFANAGRVISLVSFSKTIFPGVRMGCIVAAQSLVELLAQTKALFDREASLPLTRAVAQHIAAPAYARELARARQEYRARRDLLLDLLQRELAPLGCRWTVPAAGFSLLVSLPPECEERAAVEEAAWHGVMVLPGSCFAPVPTPRWRNTVRLSYGDLSPDQQREGVQRLARALRVVLEQHAGRIQDHSEPV